MTSRQLQLLGAIALLAAPLAAHAAIGAGSLYVGSSTSHNPTHWDVGIGAPIDAEIHGVTTAEAGSPLPATITVIIKHSTLGNTTVTGTRIGMTSNYAFTYTPPALANGDPRNACNTSIVSYISNGNNSNNDLIDDGIKNGTGGSAAGFRYQDPAGETIPCTVAVESSPWSRVKRTYR